MTLPSGTDTWVGIFANPLPTDDVAAWVLSPSCGAVSTFVGTVRDHSEGRTGITRLDYEAHPAMAEARLAVIAEIARRHWPEIGRVAMLHRTGSLVVGDIAVVVAVSTPHRREAFEATSWCIDTLKATVPIWKYEVWDGGEGWGQCTHDLVEVGDLPQPTEPAERRVPVGPGPPEGHVDTEVAYDLVGER